jgi:outer membrane cobalamin receptor
MFFHPSSRARGRALLGLLLSGGAAALTAQTSGAPPAASPPTQLDPFLVPGRATDLIGAASSASQGIVGAAELEARPFLRRGELLEVVPGVVITQHTGGGKANQYFLRGFNLDHGTDFAVSVDGMPVNLRSHAHGQGYADLNFLIPELVRQVDYSKLWVRIASRGWWRERRAPVREMLRRLVRSSGRRTTARGRWKRTSSG